MKNFKIFFVLFFSIFTLSSAFQIQCRFTIQRFWDNLGNIYHCEVTSSSALAGHNITQVTGTHMIGRTNFDVQGIIFLNNCAHINTVPRNIREFFPNLIAISMSGCGIHSLNGDELQNYNNLLSFSIQNTVHFVHIPGNLFLNTRSLLSVNFNGNRIINVGQDLLTNLRHLQTAFFFSNVCINNGAWTQAAVPFLIEELRRNCPDPNDFTTTVMTPTTTELGSTTTNEFGCVQGNYDERICMLEVENENLRDEMKKMKEDILYLSKTVLDLTSRPCAC